MFIFRVDLRNPIVHMFLWNLIATSGLLGLLLLFSSTTSAGRQLLYQDSSALLAGMLYWIAVAVGVALVAGPVTGTLVWVTTFSALVSERTITRYYIAVWFWLGVLSTVIYAGIAWWYLTGDRWQLFPLTADPRVRDGMLAVVWMVVVPLVGATRFIDTLKANPRRRWRRRPQPESSDNT